MHNGRSHGMPQQLPKPVRHLGWSSPSTGFASEMVYERVPLYLTAGLGTDVVLERLTQLRRTEVQVPQTKGMRNSPKRPAQDRSRKMFRPMVMPSCPLAGWSW